MVFSAGAHETKEKLTDMQCLPDALADREYYRPGQKGEEAEFSARLQRIKKWKNAHRQGKKPE